MLNVGIECASLKETVTQKQHSLVVVIRKHTRVHQGLTVPDTIGNLHFLPLGYELTVLRLDRHNFVRELAIIVINNENVLGLNLYCINDATHRKRDISFPRRQVDGIVLFNG